MKHLEIQYVGGIVRSDGTPVPNALECIRKLVDEGYTVSLFRSNSVELIEFSERFGIVQSLAPDFRESVIISTSAVGCPLRFHDDVKPIVNWWGVEKELKELDR